MAWSAIEPTEQFIVPGSFHPPRPKAVSEEVKLNNRLGHHYLSSAQAVERVLVRTAKANRRARP
jgi:hypothetical protein